MRILSLKDEMRLCKIREKDYRQMLNELARKKHLSDIEFVNQNVRGK